MMNSGSSLKPWWAIFFALGLCLMSFPAWADATPTVEALGLPYFSANSLLNDDEFVFESEGDERLLAENPGYSSALREKTEQSSLRGKIKLDSNYFKGIFTDTAYAATSPLRWDISDWATASVVAGVTGAFFVLDDEIKSSFQDNRSSTTDDVSELFEHFGNGAITFPALAGFYLYGRFGEHEKVERTALLAAESFLVTTLFSSVLKVGMGRTRPIDGSSNYSFDGPGTGNGSFPSGHTSTAFAIATVVANEYENVPLVAPISYGIATLTGLSRLNDQKHWASDVFFGAALGYFTSKTILKLHSNKKGRHFTIYPHADHRSGGLILSTRF
jgi:membrane-associated phospholipid phosphatase